MLREAAKQVQVSLSGSRFAISGSIWALALVLAWIGWQAEQRVTRLENRMRFVELTLRLKFPVTTARVEELIGEEPLVPPAEPEVFRIP
jgi:hypothetical protein